MAEPGPARYVYNTATDALFDFGTKTVLTDHLFCQPDAKEIMGMSVFGDSQVE